MQPYIQTPEKNKKQMLTTVRITLYILGKAESETVLTR
jgi:hypothetical protein